MFFCLFALFYKLLDFFLNIIYLFLFLFYLFLFLAMSSMWVLVTKRDQTRTPMEVVSVNHWTTR